MSERRRGLGRGLGALIPTSPEGKRPVDVFFPSAPSEAATEQASEESGGSAVATGSEAGDREAVAVAVVTVEGDRDADPASVDGPETTENGAVTVSIDALGAEPDMVGQTGTNGVDGAPGVLEASVTSTVASDSGEGTSPNRGNDVSRETPVRSVDEGSTRSHVLPDVDAEESLGSAASNGASDQLVPVPGATFAELPVLSIRPNPRQPRTVFDEGELDELVGSIKEIGVLQPIVVRPDSEVAGKYELIMGERRWRATQAAGLEVIPAIIRETEDGDLLRDALLENLHRSALNPLEEAAAYRQLLDDFGCTHDELAARIARSRPQISNTLRLLRLPPLVQRRVAAGVLSAGHARALLGLTDGAEIERLAQRIVSEGLSVRATEEIVSLGGLEEKPAVTRRPRAGQRSAAIDELATRLSDRFETRVRVDLGKNKGRLTVEFASVEDLNRILDVMAPEDPGLLKN